MRTLDPAAIALDTTMWVKEALAKGSSDTRPLFVEAIREAIGQGERELHERRAAVLACLPREESARVTAVALALRWCFAQAQVAPHPWIVVWAVLLDGEVCDRDDEHFGASLRKWRDRVVRILGRSPDVSRMLHSEIVAWLGVWSRDIAARHTQRGESVARRLDVQLSDYFGAATSVKSFRAALRGILPGQHAVYLLAEWCAALMLLRDPRVGALSVAAVDSLCPHLLDRTSGHSSSELILMTHWLLAAPVTDPRIPRLARTVWASLLRVSADDELDAVKLVRGLRLAVVYSLHRHLRSCRHSLPQLRHWLAIAIDRYSEKLALDSQLRADAGRRPRSVSMEATNGLLPYQAPALRGPGAAQPASHVRPYRPDRPTPVYLGLYDLPDGEVVAHLCIQTRDRRHRYTALGTLGATPEVLRAQIAAATSRRAAAWRDYRLACAGNAHTDESLSRAVLFHELAEGQQEVSRGVADAYAAVLDALLRQIPAEQRALIHGGDVVLAARGFGMFGPAQTLVAPLCEPRSLKSITRTIGIACDRRMRRDFGGGDVQTLSIAMWAGHQTRQYQRRCVESVRRLEEVFARVECTQDAPGAQATPAMCSKVARESDWAIFMAHGRDDLTAIDAAGGEWPTVEENGWGSRAEFYMSCVGGQLVPVDGFSSAFHPILRGFPLERLYLAPAGRPGPACVVAFRELVDFSTGVTLITSVAHLAKAQSMSVARATHQLVQYWLKHDHSLDVPAPCRYRDLAIDVAMSVDCWGVT